MTPPRKTSYENVNHNFDTPRFFSDFPRIHLKRHETKAEDNFRALSIQDRLELVEKLILKVQDL